MTEIRASAGPLSNAIAIGIGLALFSVCLFTINNALGKWAIATLPVGQFLFMRASVSMLLLGPFCWRGGLAAFRDAPRRDLQLLRVLLSAAEIVAFYWAVNYLPLADTLTFWLAAPIYVTALSAVFLGEKIGWRRWTAVIVGFVGVILVMRPSAASFTWPALIGLLGSVVYACGLMVTRSLRNTPDAVLLTGHIGGVLIFGLVSLPFAYVTPSLIECAMIVVMAVISVIASLFFIRALKLAPASVIAPYKNTMIIWGAILGFLMFGEIPNADSLIGAGIIIGASLYIFLREQSLGRQIVINPP